MDSIIKVENLVVKYNLMEERIDTLKEYIVKLLKHQLLYNEFVALDNINFEVKKGEILGIIGFNGAGKSTLLKILAGVLKPTIGNVKVNGTIAPLIEVGAGFDPDLTAKENIFLNGALLGYSRNFLKQHFNEIISFAELEKFVNVPVKNFSSGMYARLGFSIATTVNADVLIVDEVLSVGDYRFQKKCEEKINKMLENDVTIIIVSHDLNLIKNICKRVILLDHGKLIMDGDTVSVLNYYEKMNDK